MRRTITALAAVLLVVLARDRLASPIAEGLVHLGCLIIVGFVLGRLLEDLQVPKAAGFALAGFILGPDVAGVIGAFGGVVQSAGMVFLAWVGFCVGTRFKVSVPYVNWQLVTLVLVNVLLRRRIAAIVIERGIANHVVPPANVSERPLPIPVPVPHVPVEIRIYPLQTSRAKSAKTFVAQLHCKYIVNKLPAGRPVTLRIRQLYVAA